MVEQLSASERSDLRSWVDADGAGNVAKSVGIRAGTVWAALNVERLRPGTIALVRLALERRKSSSEVRS